MIFVFIFIGLVVVILLISAFMPSRYQVEKSTVINKPVTEVMDKVSDFNHYARWNPWLQMDPPATKTITGTPKRSGHKYSWHGKKIGIGSLTITGIDSKHIHFDLEFLKPWKSHAKDNWLFEDWGTAETKVTWQNSGELPWPMARLMGPMINKNLNRRGVSVALTAIALAIAVGVAVPVAMLRAADEKPGAPVQKQEPQKSSEGAKLKPATEQKLQWGETVNGLRMALAWPPSLGEPGMGEEQEFYLVVQNVSQAQVRLTDRRLFSSTTCSDRTRDSSFRAGARKRGDRRRRRSAISSVDAPSG